jgi:hypothetical protein
VSRNGFNRYGIARHEFEVVTVDVVAFSRVFELHFHHIGCRLKFGGVVQPIEFIVVSSASATAFFWGKRYVFGNNFR